MRKCSTCKKALTKNEDKYCGNCIRRRDEESAAAKRVTWSRPCQECGIELYKPYANTKWCDVCRVEKAKEKMKEQTARRKAKKDALRKKAPLGCRQKADGADRHKGKVNPYFLVRGKQHNYNNSCTIMNGE